MAISPEVRTRLDAVWGGATPGSVETVRLDFKEDAATDKESCRVALDAALCLANTTGGAVVFGLDDDAPGPDAFVGTKLDPTKVKKYIHDNSRPRLLADVTEEQYRGCRLLVVVVHAGAEIYADAKGRAPHRIGTDCVGMDPATAERLREERAGLILLHCPPRSGRSTRPRCHGRGSVSRRPSAR